MSATTGESTAGTRERLVHAMSRHLRRHGYEGSGVKQVASEAGAALGSVYHFFPGGKADLAAAAIALDEQEFGALLQRALGRQRDPARALAACTRAVAASIRDDDWVGSCGFGGIAAESAEGAPQVHAAIASAVESWQRIVAEHLRAGGLRGTDARDLAITTIALIEGAALASQIARDERPLLIAGRHLARLARSFDARV